MAKTPAKKTKARSTKSTTYSEPPRAKKLASALRRFTHDIAIIGRPGPRAAPEIFPLSKLTDKQLSTMLVELFQPLAKKKS